MTRTRPINVALTLGVQTTGGVQRYTMQVARHLLGRDDVALTAIGSHASLDRLLDVADDRRPSREVVIPSNSGAFEGIWTRFELTRLLRHRHVDVIHCTKNVIPSRPPAPVALSVFDFTTLDRPQDFDRLKRTLLPAEFERSLRNADWWLPTSTVLADGLVERFGVDAARIVTVPPAITPLADPTTAVPVDGAPASFALAVGDLSPRKNFAFLARLWPDVFEATGMQLLVAGTEGWQAENTRAALSALEDRGMGRWVGRVTDEQLRWLYDHAAVCCVPSVEEGFGFAPLEAASVGCPVVATAMPSLDDVGDAATPVPLDRPDRWIDELVRIVQHPPPRVPFVIERSADDVGEEMVEAYRRIAATSDRHRAPRPTASTEQAPKVAIVNDWLLNVGGSERVTLELRQLFPDADVYTSQYDPAGFDWFDGVDVHTTWLQQLPRGLKKFLPPLRAAAFRQLDLSAYDLVLSSSGAESKAVRARPGAVHLTYCHSPSHYYWSRYDQYLEAPGFGRLDPIGRAGLKALVRPMRVADHRGAQSADHLLVNSSHIQAEVARIYHRDSEVVHPPVDVERFGPHAAAAEERDGYVIAGRQTSYKRFDLAVQACTALDRPLLVLGDGPEHERLRAMAGPTVAFETHVSDDDMPVALGRARAFLFPGMDDFGITPVEAMAAGTPVIAYRAGGALEYVEPGITGVFFDEQTVESLVTALLAADAVEFDHAKIGAAAQRFSAARFREEIRAVVARYLPELGASECEGDAGEGR